MNALLKEIRQNTLLWLLIFIPIALIAASQIALSVAPWPGSVAAMVIAALAASLVTNTGRSTWFVSVLVLMLYLIFAMTLYFLPPATL